MASIHVLNWSKFKALGSMSLRLYDLLEKIVYFQVSGVFKAQRSGEYNTDVQDDPLANYPLPSGYPLTSCKSLTCFRRKVTSTSPSRGPWKGPRAERMRVNNQEPPLPATHHRPHCDISFINCGPCPWQSQSGQQISNGQRRHPASTTVTKQGRMD